MCQDEAFFNQTQGLMMSVGAWRLMQSLDCPKGYGF